MMHMPRFIECANAKTLVVFIHGFMGSPAHFDAMMELVYQRGCSVLSILLPGHGASMKQFIKFRYDEAQAHVQRELERCRDGYEQIYLVGHSMGGLLALNASIIEQNRVQGVFVLSAPIKSLFVSPSMFYRKIELLAPKNSDMKREYSRVCSIQKGMSPRIFFIARPAMQLRKAMRATQQNLKRVTARIFLVYSKRDETVPLGNSLFLTENLINSAEMNLIILQKSRHAYYSKNEFEIILNRLLTFINN